MLELGGKHLTEFMLKSVFSGIRSWRNIELARSMKETMCYVALDYKKELHDAPTSKTLKKDFKLPDGKVISLDTLRFECPEILFNPKTLDPKFDGGVGVNTVSTIYKSDVDIRTSTIQNVCCTGGCSLFKGFDARIKKSLTSEFTWAKKSIDVTCFTNCNSSFYGASIIASLPTFSSMWVTKAEYEETGVSIIHRKCF